MGIKNVCGGMFSKHLIANIFKKKIKMMGMNTSSYEMLDKHFQSKHLQNSISKYYLNSLFILCIKHVIMNV